MAKPDRHGGTSSPRKGARAETIPPQNEVSGGPQTPLELTKAGWRNTVKRAGKKFVRDRCSMTAGSLAYHWFLALFPALIAVLGLAGLVHLGAGTVHRLVDGLDKALPPGASGVFTQAVNAATVRSAGASLTALILGIWYAVERLGRHGRIGNRLDIAYEVPVDRSCGQAGPRLPAHARHAAPVGSPGPIVFGASIGSAIDGRPRWRALPSCRVDVVRWLLTVIVISLLFSVFYFYAPNRESPRWQWVSPGGLVGTAIFLLASLGFSFYVARFGSYGKTYGAFAGVVILIFWLYLTGLAVLLGGEINAELEREAAAQAGHPQAQASAEELHTAA